MAGYLRRWSAAKVSELQLSGDWSDVYNSQGFGNPAPEVPEVTEGVYFWSGFYYPDEINREVSDRVYISGVIDAYLGYDKIVTFDRKAIVNGVLLIQRSNGELKPFFYPYSGGSFSCYTDIWAKK